MLSPHELKSMMKAATSGQRDGALTGRVNAQTVGAEAMDSASRQSRIAAGHRRSLSSTRRGAGYLMSLPMAELERLAAALSMMATGLSVMLVALWGMWWVNQWGVALTPDWAVVVSVLATIGASGGAMWAIGVGRSVRVATLGGDGLPIQTGTLGDLQSALSRRLVVFVRTAQWLWTPGLLLVAAAGLVEQVIGPLHWALAVAVPGAVLTIAVVGLCAACWPMRELAHAMNDGLSERRLWASPGLIVASLMLLWLTSMRRSKTVDLRTVFMLALGSMLWIAIAGLLGPLLMSAWSLASSGRWAVRDKIHAEEKLEADRQRAAAVLQAAKDELAAHPPKRL